MLGSDGVISKHSHLPSYGWCGCYAFVGFPLTASPCAMRLLFDLRDEDDANRPGDDGNNLGEQTSSSLNDDFFFLSQCHL